MITLIIFAFAWILNYSLPWQVYLTTGFIDGFIFIPILTFAFAPYLGMKIRQSVSRLQFLFGTTAAGGVIAVMFRDRYEYAPFDIDKETIYTTEGEIGFDAKKSHWYRLGNQRFGVTWFPDEQTVDKYLDDEIEILEESDGVGILDRVRAGKRAVTQFADEIKNGSSDFIVSWTRAAEDLRGGGDTELSETAEEKVLEHLGGKRDVNYKWLTIGSLGTMFMASLVGVLIFGFL